MTPIEKAIQLVEKFTMNSTTEAERYAKKCALISVDEIFEHIDYIFKGLEKDNLPNKFGDEIKYWESVKYEINKL